MQKIITRRTSEKSNLCIVFTAEEQEIYDLEEDDIIQIEILGVNKEKGGKR